MSEGGSEGGREVVGEEVTNKQNYTCNKEYRRLRNFRWEIFVFLMFASFNFRCPALPMKIKPRRKFNAYCTISEEVARSRIQCLES